MLPTSIQWLTDLTRGINEPTAFMAITGLRVHTETFLAYRWVQQVNEKSLKWNSALTELFEFQGAERLSLQSIF